MIISIVSLYFLCGIHCKNETHRLIWASLLFQVWCNVLVCCLFAAMALKRCGKLHQPEQVWSVWKYIGRMTPRATNHKPSRLEWQLIGQSCSKKCMRSSQMWANGITGLVLNPASFGAPKSDWVEYEQGQALLKYDWSKTLERTRLPALDCINTWAPLRHVIEETLQIAVASRPGRRLTTGRF